ncbi:ABC-type transport system, involved in lipoprotein release, permease component [Flavobacteriaceae bacterium MAR_2010_188]|nr:ABC-type transport system, involved in lipoprotein release, permease component [Flavobacteriaceae bacterium MAR_2010_188]
MIKNYFKIALRNLWKDKVFASMNVVGLTMAFAVGILLSMYAFFELSFDRFHENSDSIYQIYTLEQTPDGPAVGIPKPIPFAPTIEQEVAGIDKISRYNGGSVLALKGNDQVRLYAAYVDPDFFSIFSFPSIEGDAKSAIADKSSIAITEYAAKNLFGSTDVLGKSVNILQDGKEMPFKVSSILKDFPDTSTISFDVVINFKSQSDFVYADYVDSWEKSNHTVYLKLNEGVSPAQFEKSTTSFTNLHYQDFINDAKRDGAQPDDNGNYYQQKLLQYADSHFTTEKNGQAVTSRVYPYMILGIALLIIFIACVNFVNMSIAKSSQRLREIGMRKTLGAAKSQLFFQFWGESLLVFTISIGLGFLVSKALMEPFRTLFSTRASLSDFNSPLIIISLLVSMVLITLVSGGYPALLMSKLGTIQALKGKLNVNSHSTLRNGLIVFQFGIAILLISGTLVLNNQLEFLRTKDLGFNKEQVLSVPLNGKQDDATVMRLLRNELANDINILSVSASNNSLGLGKDKSRGTSQIGFDYEGRNIETNILMVDYDYVETLNLEILQGRSFNRNYATDSLAIIVNESMARQLSKDDPLSKQIIMDDSLNFAVIGVIKDYNFQDLDKSIEPLTLFLKPNWNLKNAYIKVAPQNVTQTYDRVKLAWKKIEPNSEFLGSFLDENIENTLARERTMTTIITSGSIVAIVLSCIGLFAMSLLVVAQRRKEIGIRKVVGASVSSITMMLSLDFLKLVGTAFLIATPLAWWFSGQWLQNYANRVELNIWVFLLAGVIALVIAITTISFRTIKAAIANPVKSLRTE